MSNPEPHTHQTGVTLNKLRAAVLGADDGIVSVAGIVTGVAGATGDRTVIFAAGVAGLIAGAISMAAGEYVSVSSQRDTEQALLQKEKTELKDEPENELAELVTLYQAKGLTAETAQQVAKELTKHDAFAAHAEAELHIDPENLTSPWHAAIASALSFVAGALIPLIAVLLATDSSRLIITGLAVVVALIITGVQSAKVSGANPLKATIRVVSGGVLAMIVTYGIGRLVGAAGI